MSWSDQLAYAEAKADQYLYSDPERALWYLQRAATLRWLIWDVERPRVTAVPTIWD